MRLITLYLPDAYIKILDSLVGKRFYPHRSEAIRLAVRDLILVEADFLNGWFPIKDPKVWKNNQICPECGDSANPNIFACETGYNYCTKECARQHVKEAQRLTDIEAL